LSSPLHNAVLREGKEAVELLLDQGADINAWGGLLIIGQSQLIFASLTPLHMAVHRGIEDVIELLLSRGANVNAKDVSNVTALHQAAWFQHGKVVELLLKHGANIEARYGKNGHTTLHLAALRGNVTLAEALLQ
jgi:ankyrin repeat protein